MAKPVQVKGILPGDVDDFCVDWDVVGPESYELMGTFGAGRNCREIDEVRCEARRLAGPGPIRLLAIHDAVAALHGRDVCHSSSKRRE